MNRNKDGEAGVPPSSTSSAAVGATAASDDNNNTAGRVALAATATEGQDEEPRPRFGLARKYKVTSVIYATIFLCILKVASGVIVLSTFSSVERKPDFYVNAVIDLLLVSWQTDRAHTTRLMGA